MTDVRPQRVYLDTNILISAFDEAADRDLALQLLKIVEAVPTMNAPPFVTSELSLAEMLVRPLRLRADQQVRSFDNVLTTSPWLQVEPVTRSVIWGAANLRAEHRHLKLPDALHIATAIHTRCSHLLTADLGVKESYAVVMRDDGQERHSAPIVIIRPDSETLDELLNWLLR